VGSQTKPLTFVATSWSDASQPEPWGTDGMTLFPLFNVPGAALVKTLQTKQWAGTSIIVNKQVLELILFVKDKSGAGFTLDTTIDTENRSFPVQANSQVTFGWVNNSGEVFGWMNNSMQPFGWSASGASIVRLGNDLIGEPYGHVVGITGRSSSLDFVLIQAALGYGDYSAVGGV
jgi:hypothetical protein